MAEQTIYSAFIAAQKEFSNIEQSKSAQAFGKGAGYKYADINAVLDAVRPILNRNGLAIMQSVTTHQRETIVNADGSTTSKPESVTVKTFVFDGHGDKIESGEFVATTEGLTQRGIQAIGSAITYARRYSLMGFLGLAYGDNDDDGRSATEQYWSKQQTAPAPVPVKPSEALLERAFASANEGLNSYREFWKSINQQEREALKPEHERLKAIATDIDNQMSDGAV